MFSAAGAVRPLSPCGIARYRCSRLAGQGRGRGLLAVTGPGPCRRCRELFRVRGGGEQRSAQRGVGSPPGLGSGHPRDRGTPGIGAEAPSGSGHPWGRDRPLLEARRRWPLNFSFLGWSPPDAPCAVTPDAAGAVPAVPICPVPPADPRPRPANPAAPIGPGARYEPSGAGVRELQTFVLNSEPRAEKSVSGASCAAAFHPGVWWFGHFFRRV